MGSLLTNTSALTALSVLRRVGGDLEEVQQRISTGLSVRTAGDNAAFFLVAQTVRGDSTVTGVVRDNLTLAINAARTAVDSVQTIFDRLTDIQGAAALADSGQGLEELDFALGQTIDLIEDLIDGASFNGTNLLTGGDAVTAVTGITRVNGNFTIQSQSFRQLDLDDQTVAGGDSGLIVAQEGITGGVLGFVPETGAEILENQFALRARAFNPTLANRLDRDGDNNVDLINVTGAGETSADDLFAGEGDIPAFAVGNFNFAGTVQDYAFLVGLGLDGVEFHQAAGPDGQDVISFNVNQQPIEPPFGAVFPLQEDFRDISLEVLDRLVSELPELEQRIIATATSNVPGAIDNSATSVALGGLVDLGAILAGEVIVSFEGTAEEAELLRLAGLRGTSFSGSRVTFSVNDIVRLPGDVEFNPPTSGSFREIDFFDTNGALLQELVFSDSGLQEFADRTGFRGLLNQLDLSRQDGNPAAVLALTDALIARTNIAAAQLSNYQSLLEDRQEFLDALTGSLDSGIAALVEADLDEESTRLQALQVQEQLAIQGLTIANARPQTLLQLFS